MTAEPHRVDSARRPDQWDASLYDSSHSFVWRFGQDLVGLLEPRPGERIVDLGCGTGHLTNQIAAAGATVIGIDSAATMIEQARSRYPALEFHVADGADFVVDQPVDAIFSNAAIHWMRRPIHVIQSIARALRPGGRFVAEFGGKGNIAQVVRAIEESAAALGHPIPAERHPWYFPSVGEYASLLESRGFEVRYAHLFDRPTPLDGGEAGLAAWLRMFGGPLTEGIPPEQHDTLVAGVAERTRSSLWRDGTWYADYRRLRIVAIKAP